MRFAWELSTPAHTISPGKAQNYPPWHGVEGPVVSVLSTLLHLLVLGHVSVSLEQLVANRAHKSPLT